MEVDKGTICEILKQKKNKTKHLTQLRNATDDPIELEKIKRDLKSTRKSVTNTRDHVGNDVFSVTRSIDESLTPANSDEDNIEKQRTKTSNTRTLISMVKNKTNSTNLLSDTSEDEEEVIKLNTPKRRE